MFERLRRIALFQGFSDADLAQLAEELSERHLQEGEVLFYQGEVGHDCYVILQGELEVITYLDATELRLGTRCTGEIIGEMALIDRSPRSATVRAITPSDLAVLHEQHFTALMHTDPVLALGLLRDGTAHLRNTSQSMIAGLEQKNAELSRAYQELQAAQSELIRLNRLEEELAVARRIQELFLPRTLPQPLGWRLAAFNQGAQAVGGDFFDCIELPDDHLGLVVADACGKGVPAALFVALTRSLLRAASQSPRAFLSEQYLLNPTTLSTRALWFTNDYIAREHSDSNMFITLFYGVLEPRTGQMSYINAGHNPPLIIGADGKTIRELEVTTLPIGILSNQEFKVAHLVLHPGETFVGFSDGVTEALNPEGEVFGDHRLHTVLTHYGNAPAPMLLDAIAQSVAAHAAGAAQADDMTLLILQRMR